MLLEDFDNFNIDTWSDECEQKPIQIKLGDIFYDIESLAEDDKGAFIVLKDFPCVR